MKKLLTTSVSLLALSLSPVWAQSFSDAGTDYSNLEAEFWTEDAANDLVDMPDTFACIIKNSRGDLLPNGSWEALIDEEECFGGESDSSGGGGNGSGGGDNQQNTATQYARVKLESERLTNESNQNLTAYFESVDGGNYIANVDMRAGPSDNNPLGQWYFAFFNAGDEDNRINDPDDSNNYGFVNIEENDDGDIIVSSADVFSEQGFSATKASIVKYDGENVSFAGLLDENNTGSVLAGKTNDTHYYRVQFNNVDTTGIKAGNLTALSTLLSAQTDEACYARGNEWETVNRYELFNEDGTAVNMTGGFGFETTGDSPVRGYLGNWGVWLDSESAIFSPDSPTAAIESFTADSDDPVTRELNWAGGTLYRVEKLTEALADGTQFQTWRFDNGTFNFEEVFATYDATDNEFDYTSVANPSSGVVGTLTASAALASPWDAEFWSNEKQAMVRWDAAAAQADGTDQIVFTQTIDVSSAAEFLDDDSLPTFKNVESGAPSQNMPVTYANYTGNSGSSDFGGNSDTQTYILSGANPGTGLEARTLYLESGNASGLDADDDPVRFDFAMTMDSYNCSDQSCMGRYTNFTSGATPADYLGYNWPYKSVRLYDTSDADCTSDINDDDCTHYEWRFGANTWDNSILAFETNGDLVAVSPPKRFSYTHASNNERNGSKTLVLQDSGGFDLTANGDGDFEVTNATFNGNKFLLEFDGTSLHGLPATFDMSSSDWGAFVSLVNLADGTQLTDSTGENYRVKASEISQTFTSLPISDCDTAGVKFTNPTTLGISFDEIPDIEDETEYPRPDAVWADAPADDALVCTVTHGDPGNCDTN